MRSFYWCDMGKWLVKRAMPPWRSRKTIKQCHEILISANCIIHRGWLNWANTGALLAHPWCSAPMLCWRARSWGWWRDVPVVMTQTYIEWEQNCCSLKSTALGESEREVAKGLPEELPWLQQQRLYVSSHAARSLLARCMYVRRLAVCTPALAL